MIANNNLVTVLMSVYNEKEDFLRRSIESILCQTFKNFEFLIIDDGSTDNTCLAILDEYAQKDSRIRIIHNQKNLGLVKSLNMGLKIAQGKYIARIDSDDISDINRLEKQFNFMNQHPKYGLCGSWAYIINEEENIIGKKKFFSNYEEIKKNILFFNFFTHSSLFFKKSAISSIGGYNENIKKAQDYDLILNISARYPIANIPEFLCFHRIRSASISSKSKKRQEWYGIVSRLRAIFIYGYPKINFFKIIPSLFYFIFIPHFLEKIIFKFLWQK